MDAAILAVLVMILVSVYMVSAALTPDTKMVPAVPCDPALSVSPVSVAQLKRIAEVRHCVDGLYGAYVSAVSGGRIPLGHCHLVAAYLVLSIPGAEPVFGQCRCKGQEQWFRHWWIRVDGIDYDPMSEQLRDKIVERSGDVTPRAILACRLIEVFPGNGHVSELARAIQETSPVV